MRDEEFQLIPEIREGCWIHIEEATSDDIVSLAHKLGLEVTDLQDCVWMSLGLKRSKERF